ncbi:MAG: hypothetical protein AAGF58_03900 [Pseudomonadota bacterium]
MAADDHDLMVERRLSAIETKVESLKAHDTDVLQTLKNLEQSHGRLSTRIDRYQFGAKFIIGAGMTLGGFIWFVWSNFGDWFVG